MMLIRHRLRREMELARRCPTIAITTLMRLQKMGIRTVAQAREHDGAGLSATDRDAVKRALANLGET